MTDESIKDKEKLKRRRRKKIQERILYCFVALTLIIGIGLISYPTVSDWWNNRAQSKFTAQYAKDVSELDPDLVALLKKEAQAYNEALLTNDDRWRHTEQSTEEYRKYLDPSNNGVMGSIEIPKINLNLPFYHTAEESVIQVAVGHIEGSSLPIGGPSTHSALSSHRGLPSAKLFTDIDKLKIGDTFLLHVLDDILTYKIDQIEVVLPNELDLLDIIEGKDYCTLVTCTPYGVNSHRLLIRGERIPTEYNEDGEVIKEDAPVLVELEDSLPGYIIIGILIGILLLIVLKKKRRRKKHEK